MSQNQPASVPGLGSERGASQPRWGAESKGTWDSPCRHPQLLRARRSPGPQLNLLAQPLPPSPFSRPSSLMFLYDPPLLPPLLMCLIPNSSLPGPGLNLLLHPLRPEALERAVPPPFYRWGKRGSERQVRVQRLEPRVAWLRSLPFNPLLQPPIRVLVPMQTGRPLDFCGRQADV
jgi:hypothetical protein